MLLFARAHGTALNLAHSLRGARHRRRGMLRAPAPLESLEQRYELGEAELAVAIRIVHREHLLCCLLTLHAGEEHLELADINVTAVVSINLLKAFDDDVELMFSAHFLIPGGRRECGGRGGKRRASAQSSAGAQRARGARGREARSAPRTPRSIALATHHCRA